MNQMALRKDLPAAYRRRRVNQAKRAEYWFARYIDGSLTDGSWEEGDVIAAGRRYEVKTVAKPNWHYVNCGEMRAHHPLHIIAIVACEPDFQLVGYVQPERAVWGQPFVNGEVWSPCWYVKTDWIIR